MLCDKCKRNEANVHITKIVNNDKTVLNLCEQCARDYQEEFGFSQSSFSFPGFSFHKFVADLLDQTTGMMTGEPSVAPGFAKCPLCGTTRQLFAQYGKLGCDRCYDTFEASLSPIIRRVHGRERHTGKVPRRSGQEIRLKQQLAHLKRRLQELVAREEFEEAAKVRDQIRALENQNG